MICFHSNRHMLSSAGPLITPVKPQAKGKFRTAAILSFTFRLLFVVQKLYVFQCSLAYVVSQPVFVKLKIEEAFEVRMLYFCPSVPLRLKSDRVDRCAGHRGRRLWHSRAIECPTFRLLQSVITTWRIRKIRGWSNNGAISCSDRVMDGSRPYEEVQFFADL